jgi:hypothetical protein
MVIILKIDSSVYRNDYLSYTAFYDQHTEQ